MNGIRKCVICMMDIDKYYVSNGGAYGAGYIDYDKWEKNVGSVSDFIKDLGKIQPELT